MTAPMRKPHVLLAGTVLTVAAIAATALGIVFTSGLGFADAAGQPLGVPAVSIAPTPLSTVESGAPATPTPTPTSGHDDGPEVASGPPPVTVELDDHGGQRSGTSDDNSGHGNSGD